ncbi:MAG: PA14 domain-containing protein, partial [Rhodanobacteraceae bacterium]
MNTSRIQLAFACTLLSLFSGIGAVHAAPGIDIAQQPLFTTASQPPLNMLVLDRDHKLFNAAYNDASDLNGDGTLDIGYKPSIEYYGYFDSHKCYAYNAGVFAPQSVTANKTCGGTAWSGDFLNYVTMSRIDALRKVLYGGYRSTDSTTQTILERAYIPQDGHTFGKEYQSVARDGYDIHDYTPYSVPADGKYLLFSNNTLISAVAANNSLRNPSAPPLMRVMQNSPFRIWNWDAIEGPVGGNDCFNAANSRVDCLSSGGTTPPNGHPNNAAEFQQLKDNYARSDNIWGSDNVDNIYTAPGSSNNDPYQPDPDDYYLTIMSGAIKIDSGHGGNYNFAVDGDDAVELWVDGTVRVGWYGGHGDCGGNTGCLDSHATGTINLGTGRHDIEFRHEEQTGGDNFRLYWKTPSSGTWTIVPKRTSSNGAGFLSNGTYNGATRTFYDLTIPPPSGAATRTDYTVRVKVCVNGLLEDNCEKYTNSTNGAVSYKPTGLMHDYGETDQMMFGLISGSFMHNKQGGVLRKQMGSFKDEINFDTGQFVTPKKGLIATLDGIKIQSLNSDTNPYSNPHHTWHCSPGWSSNQPDGECRAWGDPIGEMMFETLRYFGGAGGPEPEYTYTDAGSDDQVLGMPEVSQWKDPYAAAPAGGGFLECAKPFETVISDVNPSYDSELPGNAFGAAAPTGSLPTKLQSLDVAAEGQAIWNNEGYGTRNVYIGQSGNLFDAAPTAKIATSFGNIRGLSPEEPTKQGTYYSASVAYFGHNNDLSEAPTDQNLHTFSVALSSPLPRIQFPINGHDITLVPFAKSIDGCIGVSPSDAFIPTNQIVGFYVEKIVNVPGQPSDPTINGGRPYAKFRISYEDAEQGNDYDMDAIVSYQLSANADNTLSVSLNSEYAAGCAIQHIGYVISGSNADGVYLEVRDKDTAAG